MPPEIPPSNQTPAASLAYRFWRGVIRLWFHLNFGKINILHEERLETPAAVLMAVSHPESFLAALILVAAMERPVRCVIEAKLVRGLLASWMARGLGMIVLIPEEGGAAPERCLNALAENAVLVTFAQPTKVKVAAESAPPLLAASIALDAESRAGSAPGILLFPVHLFVPAGRARAILIDIAPPVNSGEQVPGGGQVHDRALEVSKVLGTRFQENSFRLRAEDLAEFLGDLEKTIRIDFEESKRPHPEGEQTLNGFEISRFVVDWTEQVNYTNPGLLVSLRESAQEWLEARRLCSLHRLEVEGAGPWLSWPIGRAVVWLETLAGFGVALYGLINHLGAIALLYLTGYLKKDSGREKNLEWLVRGLMLLGYYILAVFLVAHFWGRRAAGFYAPSLPFSALYLWRYASMLRHQIRIAFLSLSLPAATAKTRRRCKSFLHEINEALDQHAEALGLPH